MPEPVVDDEGASIVDEAQRVIAGAGRFKADMKARGIHVGKGTPARCVCCDLPWPCESSEA